MAPTFWPVEVVCAGRLVQCVAPVYRPILCLPAFGAPAAVLDAVRDGEVQCGPVRAGLAPDTIF